MNISLYFVICGLRIKQFVYDSSPSVEAHDLTVSIENENSLSTFLTDIVNRNKKDSSVVEFIQNTIKYDTVQKFTTPLCRTRLQNSGLEGFKCSEVIVNSKSDLTSFLHLMEPLLRSAQQDSGRKLRFNPSLQSFRSQSRATQLLSVDFSTLRDLLQWISIHDPRDIQTISVKCTTRKNDSLLRILGTSALISIPSVGNSSSSRIDVDCLLPFSSCTVKHVQHLESALMKELTANEDSKVTTKVEVSNTDNFAQKQNVLYRCRVNYDESQGRYLSPWKVLQISIPLIFGVDVKPEDSSATTTQQESSFTIQWSQCRTIPTSMWTTDARFTGLHVLGDISTFSPTLTFFGSSTIKEIKQLLSTHFL